MTTGVASHAVVLVVDFDRAGRGANLHHLSVQPVGDAVVVTIELHVVVDVDACFSPVPEFKALGGERFQGRSIQLCKQAGPTAGAVSTGSVVELLEQCAE